MLNWASGLGSILLYSRRTSGAPAGMSGALVEVSSNYPRPLVSRLLFQLSWGQHRQNGCGSLLKLFSWSCLPVCRFLRLPQSFPQNLRLQLCGFFFHGIHPCPTSQDTQDCKETRATSVRARKCQHPPQGRAAAAGYGALL